MSGATMRVPAAMMKMMMMMMLYGCVVVHVVILLRGEPVYGFVIPPPPPRLHPNLSPMSTPRYSRPFTFRPLELSAMEPMMLATATTTTTTPGSMDPLVTYLIQTLITNGVPALFSILVVTFVAWQLRTIVSANNGNGNNNDKYSNDKMGNRNTNNTPLALLYDDLYGDQDQDPLQKGGKRNNFFAGGWNNNNNRNRNELPKNTGVPKLQYIQVTHLNPKYDSYRYSMIAKTQSKASAAAQYRQAAWQRAWGKALFSTSPSPSSTSTTSAATSSLTPNQIQRLVQLEQDFLKDATIQQEQIQLVMQALQRNSMDESMKKILGMDSIYQLDPPPGNTTATTTTTTTTTTNSQLNSKNKASTTTLSALQMELVQMELKFVQDVIQIVGPTHAAAVRTAVLGSTNGEGFTQLLVSSSNNNNNNINGGMQRPLTQLLVGKDDPNDEHGASATITSPFRIKKNVYVTRFPGDLNASQVATLREEITAILQSAPRPHVDEVVVILQTGGGTVTGYGLAAAQLQRIKQANIRLTIAVEQVAASGGYMMACIADKIVASPFAVLGSIGVISDIPNVYERLKNEGIEFQTVTAGK
jgi:Peptidase family S49 N-terminal/Peptidase family S49